MAGTILYIANNSSQLVTDNEDLKQTLWRLLRFRERGYFHSTLYKRKLWDGFRDFFSITSGRFLTGLLPEVELVLEHFGVEYEVKDSREKFQFLYDSIDKDFLRRFQKKGEKPFELYDYQVEFVNKVLRHPRATIQAPTASGKTETMIAFLKCLPPKTPTMILGNRSVLLEQNREALAKWKFKDVGVVGDGSHDPNVITIANLQSLHIISKLIPHVKVLVVDEVHDLMSASAKKWYQKFDSACVRVSLSATPFKYGGKHQTQKYSVKGYFGPIMQIESAGEDGLLKTKDLQEQGRLSKDKCIFYPVDSPDLSYYTYPEAVTYGIARNLEFHQMVVRLVKKLRGRTLILVERLEHGDTLLDLMPGAIWVRGKDNKTTRKYVIEELRKSKLNRIAIATQGIFNTGVNVFVHNLVNAAGGDAEHVVVQRMGRGLRTAEDKDILHYYDFIFNINEHLLSHSMHRVKILQKEGHDVEVRETLDF